MTARPGSAAAVAAAAWLLAGCGPKAVDTAAPEPPADSPFRDVTATAGIAFHHVAGAAGGYLFPEINGSGGALLDFDGDGDLDVYLIQGGRLDPHADPAADLVPPPPDNPPGNRLWRNDTQKGGPMRFVDVTDQAGVGDTGYGMGAATGDIDGDGDVDLYVTNVGANVLYRNQGDGTFMEIAGSAGVDDNRWNTSAAFVDYDADGDLDLFVNAYVDWSAAQNIRCRDDAGREDYCAPAQYQPLADRLYRNDGTGAFTDVSAAAGIGARPGPGLGVQAADFDADGRVDLFVANDQSANFLWRNVGDGTFEETGLMTGVAYNADGAAEASMGVAVGDVDGDGDEDLFMTHLTTQTNTLYMNDGDGNFIDGTQRSNLGAASLRMTGFGAGFIDFDNDGDLDIFAANGAVAKPAGRTGLSAYPYEQPNQLFVNDGRGRYAELTGADPSAERVSRGAVFGDIDNDGDTDILVTNNNGPAQLLQNTADTDAWLRVALRGTASPRSGAGARVGLQYPDGRTVWRRAHTDGSYLSAGDPRVLFGLGTGADPVTVIVVWPSGLTERWPAARGSLSLEEGQGKPVQDPD